MDQLIDVLGDATESEQKWQQKELAYFIECVKSFNRLMSGEMGDEEVQVLLKDARQYDMKFLDETGAGSAELDNTKKNLKTLMKLHLSNPSQIDVPQLLRFPEEGKIQRVPLDLLLLNYNEQAVTKLSAINNYDSENGVDNNSVADTQPCSFLCTLKDFFWPDTSERLPNGIEDTSGSLSDEELPTGGTSESSTLSSLKDDNDSEGDMSVSQKHDSFLEEVAQSSLSSFSGTGEHSEPMAIDLQEENDNISQASTQPFISSETGSAVLEAAQNVTEENSPDTADDTVCMDVDIDTERQDVSTSGMRESPSGGEHGAQHAQGTTSHSDPRVSRRRKTMWAVNTELKEPLLIQKVWTEVTANRCAFEFWKPLKFKGYVSAIKKPVTLTTIKKKLDKKEITSVKELKRELFHMLANAVMFNSTGTYYNKAAKEIAEIVEKALQEEREYIFEAKRRSSPISDPKEQSCD